MSGDFHVPVLVTAFNRPRSLERCLNALRACGAHSVLVSIDGPRPGHPTDDLHVAESVELAEKLLPLFPAAQMRVSSKNLGLARSVTSSVDWGFESSPSLIVVEDDIVVSEQFLTFAQTALRTFRGNPDVGSVAGSCLVPAHHLANPDAPARLSYFSNSWGWATWENRWELMSALMRSSRPTRPLRFPPVARSISARTYWDGILRDTDRGKIDSWAYRWLALHWQQHWSAVISNRNLVVNRGFSGDATHTTREAPKWLPSEVHMAKDFNSSLTKLSGITHDLPADLWLTRHHFRSDPMHLWYSRYLRWRRTTGWRGSRSRGESLE